MKGAFCVKQMKGPVHRIFSKHFSIFGLKMTAMIPETTTMIETAATCDCADSAKIID
jgi:hypothetical protein